MSLNLNLSLSLDDLGSFDGSDGDAMTPRSPQGLHYNPIGLTIGELSPSRSVSSSAAESYARNELHSVHGVHMHVQENAKIPLLNQAVDRTNSSIRANYHPKSPPDDGGFSLAELFLNKESKYRESQSLNYAGFGSFLDDVAMVGSNSSSRRPSVEGKRRGDQPTLDDDTHLEIDALTAAIDPTPWSEIERKMNILPMSGMDSSAATRETHTHDSFHPHHYSYYPYGRHHQLPIPERIPSPPHMAPPPPLPPKNDSVDSQSGDIAQALARAAALASVAPPPISTSTSLLASTSIPLDSVAVKKEENTTTSSEVTTTTTTTNKHPTKAQHPPPPPHTKKSTPTTHRPTSHISRHRATYSPPEHAVAHATSRASVMAAASQKNQYGFGGNHMVPSVPAPPPMAPPTEVLEKPPPPQNAFISNAPSLPALSSESSVGHSGAAYERKKQRAKDARVKLNDAIERLSIAMSLAGSQSKQRSNLLGARISKTEQRSKSLEINEECVKLSESAKKWDRPSFVATAASLVQALNSQCESLTRELICLQERLDATTGTTSGVPGSVPLPLNNTQTVIESTPKRHQTSTDNADQSPCKRIRTENPPTTSHDPATADDHTSVQKPSDETIIFGTAATMLDPLSLCRCHCVSKTWRDLGVFQDDSIWLELAVKRFGFFNVRQWTEKMEDSETDGSKLSQKRLYRAMNGANVMPHIQNTTGLTLLGDAKIPGRMSAWVFMVERSNGETVRSVKRDPTITTPGTGAYQSRPVVELRIVLQNTAMGHNPIIIKNQQIAVDVSTRRSGGELQEIYWDDRFTKVVKALDGTNYQGNRETSSRFDVQGELCRLGLFDAAIINVHIDAKGCSTTSKFRQRSNFTKILISLEGTTVPMVIPFLRDGSQGH